MMLTLLAAALSMGRMQINPPGTSVMPTQAAFYSAAGGTAKIEVRDSTGLTVPFVDAIGVKRGAVTITLPAATAVGLGWEITQTAPDSTDYLKAVQSQYTIIVTMLCSATESPVGTFDSSAGAGNGIAAGYPAPSASTPTFLRSGSTYVLSYGGVVTTAGSSSLSVGKLDTLLAASQLGNVSGTYVSGAHNVAQIRGENASSTTVYLQIYDATSQPSNGTVPVAEITVPFGISTAPSGSSAIFSPDWVGVSTGVWFCFVTTPGAFNSSNLVSSGTGLLVRIYGQ